MKKIRNDKKRKKTNQGDNDGSEKNEGGRRS